MGGEGKIVIRLLFNTLAVPAPHLAYEYPPNDVAIHSYWY
jgi:hypothetical protein